MVVGLVQLSISLYSPRPAVQSSQTQSNILDSFGGLAYSALPAVSRAPAAPHSAPSLPRPPRWLRRTRGAKFGVRHLHTCFIH